MSTHVAKTPQGGGGVEVGEVAGDGVPLRPQPGVSGPAASRRARIRRRIQQAALLLLLFAAGCGGASQIGTDEEAFSGVDALYTAVTTQRADLLAQCKTHLTSLKAEGKLPAPAFSELEPIIAQAEQGSWRPAAERLYAFMRQQRKGRS